MASTDDEKYGKINRRQQLMRRNVCLVGFVVVLFLAMIKFVSTKNKQSNAEVGAPPLGQQLRAALSASLKPKQVVLSKSPPASERNIEQLNQRFVELETETRAIKASGVIMETDPHSLEVTGKLQVAARNLCKARYGDFGETPYRVRIDILFQPSQPEWTEENKDASILIEIAPLRLIPYSVFRFLEMARGYKSGGVHRNAGHVLQAAVKTSTLTQSHAFQEYSDQFPHKRGTTGFCGRPSGICWYVSIQDNTQNHGPGSQQKANPYEADSNFGRVIEGMEDVVPRIHRVMKKGKFLGNKDDWVLATAMHILVPTGDNGEYEEWKDEGVAQIE